MFDNIEKHSIIGSEIENVLRESVAQAKEESTESFGFDIPVREDIFLKFEPSPSRYPRDVLGTLSIYITDLLYHKRNDELGEPYSEKTEVYNQSKTLNIISNEIRKILYTELKCDHSFNLVETEGGVKYITTVTSI